VGRNTEAETRNETPLAVACERVLRYLRLAGFGRGGRHIRIHASNDRETHWLLTFAVSSLEEPSRDFLYASTVVEKETGDIYSFPSRAQQPIDAADMASIRMGCTRITLADLDRLEAEVRAEKAVGAGAKQGRPNQGTASEGPWD
jgi:hypothetical protein